MARGQTVVAVSGERELRKRLRAVEGGMQKLKDEHRWIADFVLSKSSPGTPRRSGRLAGTGRASGTGTASVVRFGRGASVPYAGPVHYGWPARNIQPHPWVITAALGTERTWVAHYENTIRDLVERTPGA